MRLLKKISKKKIGLEPGSVIFVGEKKLEKARIRVIDYDKDTLKELEITSIEDCFSFRDTPTISWINIDGLHNEQLLEKIGEHYGLHPLSMEDIANTGQRPKLEITDNYVLIILKMLYMDISNKEILSEQFSFIFGKNFVISFQEKVGDVFESVRERLRKTVPRTRLMNADYLAYALIDAVVDHYYVVLEEMSNNIESLEDLLVQHPQTDDLQTIHELKRQLVYMRKVTWPLREVIGGLERDETKLIKKETKIYIRDLYEHTIQVIDTVETFRDMVSGLLDIYLSSISNKMNEVMKVLTIIATIFIPLGFLAGVYGMNFDTSVSVLNMPELSSPYGYIMFWSIALIIGGGLFTFFKKKKWL
ncbi:MAG: magnesium/cobalt transporter CorA [bacterium]